MLRYETLVLYYVLQIWKSLSTCRVSAWDKEKECHMRKLNGPLVHGRSAKSRTDLQERDALITRSVRVANAHK
jgi:hypothetical protein